MRPRPSIAPCHPVINPNIRAGAADDLVSKIAKTAAARLFVDRARPVAPAFALTAQNALAVSRVTVLSVDQIVARLDQRFRLLTCGSRMALNDSDSRIF